MATRSAPADVKARMTTSLDDATIQIFIDDANQIVTHFLGETTLITDPQKKTVETYLACHLISTTVERKAISEKVKHAEIKYEGKTDAMGLNSTLYGQNAIATDTSGILGANYGKSKTFFKSVSDVSE